MKIVEIAEIMEIVKTKIMKLAERMKAKIIKIAEIMKMWRKELSLFLLTVAVWLAQPVLRAEAYMPSTPSPASRGTLCYEDKRGGIALYGEDFSLLSTLLSSLPEDVFSPLDYALYDPWGAPWSAVEAWELPAGELTDMETLSFFSEPQTADADNGWGDGLRESYDWQAWANGYSWTDHADWTWNFSDDPDEADKKPTPDGTVSENNVAMEGGTE